MGGAYRIDNKNLRIRVDKSISGLENVTKVLLVTVLKPSGFKKEDLESEMKKGDWFRQVDDEAYIRFGLLADKDFLAVLYNNDSAVSYAYFHLLGFGPSLTEYPDVTSFYEGINLGTIEGLDYFDAIKITQNGQFLSWEINKSQLPEKMKGAKKIEISGIPKEWVNDPQYISIIRK